MLIKNPPKLLTHYRNASSLSTSHCDYFHLKTLIQVHMGLLMDILSCKAFWFCILLSVFFLKFYLCEQLAFFFFFCSSLNELWRQNKTGNTLPLIFKPSSNLALDSGRKSFYKEGILLPLMGHKYCRIEYRNTLC